MIITLAILAVAAIPVTVTAQYPVITGEPNPDYDPNLHDDDILITTEPVQNDIEPVQNDIEPDLTDRPNQESHSSVCAHVGISERTENLQTNDGSIVILCADLDNGDFAITPQVIEHGSLLGTFVWYPDSPNVDTFGAMIAPLDDDELLDFDNIIMDGTVPANSNGNADIYIRLDERFEPDTIYGLIQYTKDQNNQIIDRYTKEFYILPSLTQESQITASTGIQGTVTDSNGDNVTGTVIAISKNDFSQQVSAPIINGAYTIGLGPGDYLVQVIGSNSYAPVSVTAGQMSSQNLTPQ